MNSDKNDILSMEKIQNYSEIHYFGGGGYTVQSGITRPLQEILSYVASNDLKN